MVSEPNSQLFQPIQVGNVALLHRIVLAPLTRNRGTNAHVPGPLAAEYYAQRASVPGTLLISEATLIAPKAGGYPNVPGIWNEEQIEGWNKVTSAVHAKKSFFYLQLWALGRAAYPSLLLNENVTDGYVSSSAIALANYTEKGMPPPRALDISEIQEYVQLYATAAANSMKAGFDGVEVHAANGYLIDQFLQETSNKRTDEYGGNVEGRTRFALEIVNAVVKTVGAKKTGVRLSPWSYYNDMRMSDPIPTFSHLVSSILEAHPQLAYIHVIEPRINGPSDRTDTIPVKESNDFIRDLVRKLGDGTKFIGAGGYTREEGISRADEAGDLVAYGRAFLANPDLPTRLKNDIPLTPSDRQTFYVPGDFSPAGYTDYPFANKSATRL